MKTIKGNNADKLKKKEIFVILIIFWLIGIGYYYLK